MKRLHNTMSEHDGCGGARRVSSSTERIIKRETSQQTNKEAAYSVFDAARLSDFSIYIRTHNNTLHTHNRLDKLGGLIEGSNHGLRI